MGELTNFFVTGKPRTGKTTLIKRVIENLPFVRIGGFYTEEISHLNIRQGFKIVTLDGKEGILARKGMPSPFRLGQYGINVKDLEEIGVKAIEEALLIKEMVVIDEIGKMELFSSLFRDVVVKALDSSKRVIGVIQMSNHPFLNLIRSRRDVEIHQLDVHNRETIFQIFTQRFRE
jgi:nucleoside-triphosphatase